MEMKSILAEGGYGSPILSNRLDFQEARKYVQDTLKRRPK